MITLKPEVLIIGAGPVGLGLAIELGHRGVQALVIERNDRVGYAPRAKTTNVRTREHLRRWGIADALAAASPLGIHYPSNIVFCTRLGGHFITRLENASYCQPGRNPLYSEHSQWIPQYAVEEVMRRHVATLTSVAIRFSTEMIGFAQDAGGVTARIRDLASGAESVVDAAYLVGADGARSAVREAIGAKMVGEHGIGHHYNVIFRAPEIARRHTHGQAIMYWQVNEQAPSLLGPMDRDDRWFFMPPRPPGATRFTERDMPDVIRASTGIDTPIEILSSDEWVASRLVADRYQDRRVFLAGDACHLHPPFGGFGMNMGVADAVDLGWKIAAVLQGWGGPRLLESYTAERRPVHEMVIEEAVANHALLSDRLAMPGIEDASPAGEALRRQVGAKIQATKIREFYTLGITLGYRYIDSPICIADGSKPPARDYLNYRPSAHPGCLAPHAWLHDGASLYDRFGWGFTLLVTDSGEDHEVDSIVRAARAANVPLEVIRPNLPVLGDLYGTRYALIRPDQHVGWRGNSVTDAGAILEIVSGWASRPAGSALTRKRQ